MTMDYLITKGQKSMLDSSLLYTNKFYGDLRFEPKVELKVYKESIHFFLNSSEECSEIIKEKGLSQNFYQ